MAQKKPNPLISLAFVILIAGFAVEVIGFLLDQAGLFKIGLFLFLMSIPCYLSGKFLLRENKE